MLLYGVWRIYEGVYLKEKNKKKKRVLMVGMGEWLIVEWFKFIMFLFEMMVWGFFIVYYMDDIVLN